MNFINSQLGKTWMRGQELAQVQTINETGLINDSQSDGLAGQLIQWTARPTMQACTCIKDLDGSSS